MRAQDNDTTARDRDRDGQQTRDNDTRDGKITPADNECAGSAVQCSAHVMSHGGSSRRRRRRVVLPRRRRRSRSHSFVRSFVRSLGCFMSALAPRAENMLFATGTHSDCISATNAVALRLALQAA